MNAKVKILLGLLLVAIAISLAFFLIGFTHEPVDPFPRAERTTKCANNSSIVFYQSKAGWFTSETEWSVTQFDQHRKLIRRQVLFTLPSWNDSEMHRTPEEFCDDKYWTRTGRSP
jgi:hypothetical protein